MRALPSPLLRSHPDGLFAGFLRRRRLGRHFRRLALFEGLHAPGGLPREAPQALAARLTQAADEPLPALLDSLGSRPEGLTARQARAVRRRVGPNIVQHERPLHWSARLWQAFRNPFNLLLVLLAAVSWLGSDERAAGVIGAMVLLSTGLRFVQEARSGRAADRLKDLVASTASVLRSAPARHAGAAASAGAATGAAAVGARTVELPLRELVPGDVVRLSAGDMIPADCRVLQAKDLFVSQAAMTGESLPVEKFADEHEPLGRSVLERDVLLFMGTNVVSGSATAVVLATGNATYFGTVAEHASAAPRGPTAFQAGINQVSWLLIRFMAVMAPVVFLVNGLTKGDWLQALLFALSVAVGLTPEMLPMIVTSTLAKGAVGMARRRVIVKRLDAIQNFGAMDVLCADKTGTLTQDRIFLARHCDAFGAPSDAVLEAAFLNSHYQTGLKNLLDVAVLQHVELHRDLDVAGSYAKVDEIPFDFERRRMSVVVHAHGAQQPEHHLLICKGALEEVLAVCTSVRQGEDALPLDDAHLARIRQVTAALNDEGLRVVAVAVKAGPTTQSVYGVADEARLTLLGFVAFLDPPKESTAPALRMLADHGVQVKVLTGDNERVSLKICREVGLPVDRALLGAQIDAMDDAQLAAAVREHRLFAKLTPLHKERLVKALRAQGHVVGFMGDGINDAPALRAADIGISVDTAVDIAKEAADIILLEKSLLVLGEGVLQGRRVFSNMLKYIRMTASSNFGNVLSVLAASLLLPFLPMLPLQLLVQNLLYDLSQTGIPFDRVDDELIGRPLAWQPAGIGRFMLCFGPLSSVFDLATFAVLWWVFAADTPAEQGLFQSGWFVVGLLTQTLIVHLIRTPRLPGRANRPSVVLAATTFGVALAAVLLPYSPLAAAFGLRALPPAFLAWAAALLAGYVMLVSLVKRRYVRRWGWL